MKHGEPQDRALVADEIDNAPCAELRHREPGDLGKRFLVIQRLEKRTADLSEEKRSSLRFPPLVSQYFSRPVTAAVIPLFGTPARLYSWVRQFIHAGIQGTNRACGL